jgi:two-component system, sensor histidine kinase and response regulator
MADTPRHRPLQHAIRSRSRQRVWWLVGTVTATLLVAEAITITLLLGVMEDGGREQLRATARRLGDLVEAVARFDARSSQQDHPEGAAGATLSQVSEALRSASSEDVEILIARRDTDGITIVLAHQPGVRSPMPETGPAAMPFVAALDGNAGLVRTVDRDGRAVWCAHRPLPTLKMALVVQKTVAGMRAPVLQAGAIAAVVAVILGGAGVLMMLKQASPLLDELATQAEASRAKSAFLSNMSHEIRTPLNAIVGLLHLLRGSQLTGKAAGYAKQIDSSAVSLQRLINDILDLSKIEAGMMELDRTRFRLDALLETVANQLSVQVGDKPVELMFSVDPALPLELDGDPLRLQQVLVNLATNAVKFTERGSVVVEVKLAGRVGDEATIRFSVRDTGIGIAPADLARLFEKFTQVDVGTSRRHGGTGLGLAISKELVGLMGGDMTVESTLGTGTTFSFLLRMMAANGDLAKRFTLPEGLGGLHVMVVDDLALSRDLLRSLLNAFGCRVSCAASGAEALDLWRGSLADPIRLALVDWRMPDVDGLEVIRRLRADTPGLATPKTILITGANRAALRDEDLVGLDGFLIKPVDPSSLFNAVIAAIASTPRRASAAMVASLANDRTLGNGRRILVAEDHAINQTIIRELLQESGFTVDVANDGARAIAAAQQTRYDLVLMDIHMPVMDGVAATKKLRADPLTKDLPIIALTADAMLESREEFRAAGMDDVVAKPINIERLLGVLQRHLRKPPAAESVLPLWDTTGGIERTGGNAVLYHRLVATFASQEADIVKRIDAAFQAGDIAKADALAHALKGLSGNLGFARLADAASRLHDHWRLNRPGDAAALIQQVAHALAEALAASASATSPHTTSGEPV